MNAIDFELLCSNIRKLTESNNHTEALKLACSALKYEDLAFVMSEVERLHIKNNSISSELLSIRENIRKRLLINVYSDYCLSIYNDIKNSF